MVSTFDKRKVIPENFLVRVGVLLVDVAVTGAARDGVLTQRLIAPSDVLLKEEVEVVLDPPNFPGVFLFNL